MNRRFWIALFTMLTLPGLALADAWKDESGKGRAGCYTLPPRGCPDVLWR